MMELIFSIKSGSFKTFQFVESLRMLFNDSQLLLFQFNGIQLEEIFGWYTYSLIRGTKELSKYGTKLGAMSSSVFDSDKTFNSNSTKSLAFIKPLLPKIRDFSVSCRFLSVFVCFLSVFVGSCRFLSVLVGN